MAHCTNQTRLFLNSGGFTTRRDNQTRLFLNSRGFTCFCDLMRLHAFWLPYVLFDGVIFEDAVTRPQHALRGVGLVEWCTNLKSGCLLWAVAVVFNQCSFFRLLFLRVDFEYNRPSFLATVFSYNSAFNGDLNQWDVAKVTTMVQSKSIRIVENALTWHEVMLLRLEEGSVGCLWLVVMMWCKDGREVVLKNGGDGVLSVLPWPIVPTKHGCF